MILNHKYENQKEDISTKCLHVDFFKILVNGYVVGKALYEIECRKKYRLKPFMEMLYSKREYLQLYGNTHILVYYIYIILKDIEFRGF